MTINEAELLIARFEDAVQAQLLVRQLTKQNGNTGCVEALDHLNIVVYSEYQSMYKLLRQSLIDLS